MPGRRSGGRKGLGDRWGNLDSSTTYPQGMELPSEARYHNTRPAYARGPTANGRGQATDTLYRLVSSILDPTAAPAAELAGLSAQRWEIEMSQAHCPHTGRGRCLCGARVA